MGSAVGLGISFLPFGSPGTINLNGIVENTTFTGQGEVFTTFVVPKLAASTQVTLILPAVVNCCTVTAGPSASSYGAGLDIARLQLNYTGTSTLLISADQTGLESLTSFGFVSSSSMDVLTILVYNAIPEPATFASGLGALALMWCCSQRRSWSLRSGD